VFPVVLNPLLYINSKFLSYKRAVSSVSPVVAPTGTVQTNKPALFALETDFSFKLPGFSGVARRN
jgi:hypothetical protein